MNPRGQEKLRRLKIGHKLIYGPRALFPPKTIDDFGWLEPDLRIIYWTAGMLTAESIILFTDNTMNRDKNFLQPVIRHAKWHRLADAEESRDWPTVEISLSNFKDQRECVDTYIKKLQGKLTRLTFELNGLQTQRESSNQAFHISYDYGRGSFSVYSRNGAQSIEYHSLAIKNDNLTELVLEGLLLLHSLAIPYSREGWRERYDFDLNEICPTKAWDWTGIIPNDKSLGE